MKLNKNELLQAIQKIMPGTDQKSYIEGVDTITFKTEILSTYNDNISVSTFLKSDLQGTVKAQDLQKLLQKLGTEEIEIECQDEIWQITSGNTQAELKLRESKIDEYIEQLELPDQAFSQLPDNFIEGLKLCKIAGNNDYLRGIFIEDKFMVSTDQVRINYYDLSAIMPRFWIDDMAVTELLRLSEKVTHFAVADSWVHFKGENETIFSCKRNQDNQYPIERLIEYKQAYKKTENDELNQLPKNFKVAIDRVGVFNMDMDGYQAIKLNVKKEHLMITGEKDTGKIKEKLQWEKPFENDIDISFMTDFSFLKEIFDKSPMFFIRKDEEQGTTDIVFIADNFTQMLRTIAE